MRTTNGGQTWQGTRVVASGYCHLEYIQFLNTSVGYCSGPCGVFKSTNGGATWSAIDLGYPDSTIWGGWFKNVNEGWVTGGGCRRNKFYRTTDGGASWSLFLDTTETRSNLSDPLWQSDMPTGVVYAIGNGTLWKSTDDGDSWAVEGYTGATSPWHEELARYESTFLIPNARSNCGANHLTGGMRWSHDNGQTWSEFVTDSDMFGTFLLNTQNGWAAGLNGNVWQTTNGGASWMRRDCGLSGRHMDDIFFQNDSTGWVVGKGIFKLAPPLRIVSDTTMHFIGACPDSGVRDTIWVTNENFNSSPWTIELVGDDAWMYRVANIVADPLPACNQAMVVVEYKPSVTGTRRAYMHIRVQQPDTLIVVELIGQRTPLNAGPRDTLVEFKHRVGQPIDRVLEWVATAPPNETILFIQRVSGSQNISLDATFQQPINIGIPATQTPITGMLSDTGWVEARFKVVLGPCVRDTFITIRVYGESPIIEGDSLVAVHIGCKPADTVLVPLSNTGNIDLTVYSVSITGLSPEVFAVLGMRSAGNQAPWKIAPGTTDTLMLLVQPTSNDHQAILQINHDDYSTARGNVQPKLVQLRVQSQRVVARVSPLIIQLGELCNGQIQDTAIRVDNIGPNTLTLSARPSSTRIIGITGNTITVPKNDHRMIPFRWIANGIGSVEDTIVIKISPCDSLIRVIVRALVTDGNVEVLPDPLVDSVFVGDVLTRTITISNLSSADLLIESIRFSATDTEFTSSHVTPTTIAPKSIYDFTVTWMPTSVRTYTTQMIVKVSGACNGETQSQITLQSMSNVIEVRPGTLNIAVNCSATSRRDSVEVIARSRPVEMSPPDIIQQDGAFRLISPLTSFTTAPGASAWVVVEYDPQVSTQTTATLQLETADRRDRIEVPLIGSSEISDWSLSPQNLLFDDLRSCDAPQYDTILLTNNNTAGVVVVASASLPPWVTLSENRIALAPSETHAVVVTCFPSLLPTGVSSYVIRFRDETCGQEFNATVSATRLDGILLLDPDPIDAGRIQVGTSVQVQANIVNPTSESRTIVSLSVVPPRPEWTIVTPLADVSIPPGGTISVTLQFSPTDVASYPARLEMLQAERCTTTTSVDMLGEGVPPITPPQYAIRLWIDDYRVPAGTKLTIPVHWSGNVQQAGVDSCTTEVHFSPLHLHVDRVVPGMMPDADIVTKYNNGVLSITARSTGPEFGQGGTVAVIEGTAQPALPDSTLFTFVNTAVWSVDKVTVEEQPGLLEVDVCGPRNLIIFVTPTTAAILPPHPANGELAIQIEAPYTEHVTLELVDVNGILAAPPVLSTIASGTSVVTLNVLDVPSGAYTVRMVTQRGGLFTMPVVIVH